MAAKKRGPRPGFSRNPPDRGPSRDSDRNMSLGSGPLRKRQFAIREPHPSHLENDRIRSDGFTEKVIRRFVLNGPKPQAPGIESPRNAIPVMEITLRLQGGVDVEEECSRHYATAA